MALGGTENSVTTRVFCSVSSLCCHPLRNSCNIWLFLLMVLPTIPQKISFCLFVTCLVYVSMSVLVLPSVCPFGGQRRIFYSTCSLESWSRTNFLFWLCWLAWQLPVTTHSHNPQCLGHIQSFLAFLTVCWRLKLRISCLHSKCCCSLSHYSS